MLPFTLKSSGQGVIKLKYLRNLKFQPQIRDDLRTLEKIKKKNTLVLSVICWVMNGVDWADLLEDWYDGYFQCSIDNFSKYQGYKPLKKMDLITCFFFTEISRLARSETPNITFVRAVDQKIWDQRTKGPVTNVKVPVTTIFRNAREFPTCRWKLRVKNARYIFGLPVTTFV